MNVDVVVVGGGQAALALGFYLRRSELSYIILDEQPGPGGAWRNAWTSLHAFSPAQWSSLSGKQMRRIALAEMETEADEYPSRDEVVNYLADYEAHYGLPMRHGTHVHRISNDVQRDVDRLRVITDAGDWLARAVTGATGNRPYIPDVAELEHLESLGIVTAIGRVDVAGVVGTRSVRVPSVWLVGYGDWTGYASATLVGVGRSARATVDEIRASLSPS